MNIEPAELVELTASQQQSREENELVVNHGIKMWLSACRALRTLRDLELFRSTHHSWEAYVTETWPGIFGDVSTADRWINLADVNDETQKVGVSIGHDRHARELAKYDGAIQQAVALVGVRAAELESQAVGHDKPVTESHFKHAGRVIAEMVTTGTVDLGDSKQHPVIEALASSVVISRRESVLQRITPRQPVLDVQKTAMTIQQANACYQSAENERGIILVGDMALEAGKTYEVRIYEVAEPK